MATKEDPNTVKVFKGIDNTSPIEDLGLEWLREARNVDLTATGRLQRREGYSQVTPLIQHSAWCEGGIFLGIGDGTLRRMTEGGAILDLCAVSDRPMAYALVGNGDVHFSNDQIHGVLSGATGIDILRGVGTYDRSDTFVDATEDGLYYDPPPAGYLLDWSFGRLFVVDKHGVWFSQSFFPRRFDMEHDYIPMADVTMFRGVAGGFYLGTTRETFFCAGTNPKQMQVRPVSSGAVLGTAIVCDADLFALDGITGRVCVWESVKGGKMLGTEQGQVIPLTKRASWNTGDRGSSVIREKNGQTHHLSVLSRDSDDDNNFRSTDIAVAEVIRNGIII